MPGVKPSSLNCCFCVGTSWVASPTTKGLKRGPNSSRTISPTDGVAFLARARARATFHRFTDALGDLDDALRLGADPADVDAERAAIFQAVGRYDEAFTIFRNAVERRADFASLAALASLCADRGDVATAEQLIRRES